MEDDERVRLLRILNILQQQTDKSHPLTIVFQCFAKRQAVLETGYIPLQKPCKSRAAVTATPALFRV